MGRRLVGSLMFVGVSIYLFEIAGRLASEMRAGWGWFLCSGLMLSGVAFNLWAGEVPPPGCTLFQKPPHSNDFE